MENKKAKKIHKKTWEPAAEVTVFSTSNKTDAIARAFINFSLKEEPKPIQMT